MLSTCLVSNFLLYQKYFWQIAINSSPHITVAAVPTQHHTLYTFYKRENFWPQTLHCFNKEMNLQKRKSQGLVLLPLPSEFVLSKVPAIVNLVDLIF